MSKLRLDEHEKRTNEQVT